MSIFARSLMFLAAASLAVCSAQALPRVEVDRQCEFTGQCAISFAQILDFLHEHQKDLPQDFDFWHADLELGAGDGVPDYFQAMLLSSALCSGDRGIRFQFDANRVKVTEYVGRLEQWIAWVDGVSEHAASAAEEIRLFNAAFPINTLLPNEHLEEILRVLDILAQGEPWPELISQLDRVRDELRGLVEEIAAVAGLSTEMLQTFQRAVDARLVARANSFQDEVAAVAANLELAIGFIARLEGLYARTGELESALRAIVDDIHQLQALIQALPFPQLSIYGVSKAAGEPFSGAGDYDGDGVSNSETYLLVSESLGDADLEVDAFVQAASAGGADPPAVPAAGVVALGILAAVISAAGAFVMFRR